MGTKLNKETYQKLIDEDILALNKHMPEFSLEKKHTIDVLKQSIDFLYPKNNTVKIISIKTIYDIKQGDTLIITGDSFKNEIMKAQIVVISEKDGTEIIIDKKMNKYFNLGMYLQGKSWVKNVLKITV